MNSNSAASIASQLARNLKWHQLLALHEMYVDDKTSAALSGSYFKYLRSRSLIGPRLGNRNVTEARPRFHGYYERHHKADFERYSAFLAEADLKDDGKRRYSEAELVTLMLIYRESDEIRANLTSGGTLASRMFGSSKYLLERPGLESAVLQLLNIDRFPDRDLKNNQWRCVVDCLAPKLIILCENLTYLKLPWLAHENNVELWYVGGNNIAIIDSIAPEKLSLPVYYSCDWDHDGLHIYSRIRRKLLDKNSEVTLLLPYDTSFAISVDSPHHKSKWKTGVPLSNLSEGDFTEPQKKLIADLISHDKWIEEQTQDFIPLLRGNGIVEN